MRNFTVEVDLVAEMTVINPFDFFLEPYAEKFPFGYEDCAGAGTDAVPGGRGLPGRSWRRCLKTIDRDDRRRTIDFLVGINQRLQQAIKYVIRMEPGVQIERRHVEVGERFLPRYRLGCWCRLLRHLGLAARFVSGYLIQLKPDMKPLDGARGHRQRFHGSARVGRSLSARRGLGGLDPTSGLFAGEGHIPLAATPEPSSAAPVSGGVDPCEVEFEHEMAVTRIHEDPRVTQPYTDRAVGANSGAGRSGRPGNLKRRCAPDHGRRADLRLHRRHGRRGMEHRGAGPREAAARRASARPPARAFAPGGLLHYGQGKWYPGEPLPRWAFDLLLAHRRRAAVARPRAARARRDRDYSLASLKRERFAETLAARLGLDPGLRHAAYEDPLYYLHHERQLPINVDPLDNQLEDPEERERLRQVFERGLEHAGRHTCCRCSAAQANPGRSGKPDCGCCAGSICF